MDFFRTFFDDNDCTLLGMVLFLGAAVSRILAMIEGREGWGPPSPRQTSVHNISRVYCVRMCIGIRSGFT